MKYLSLKHIAILFICASAKSALAIGFAGIPTFDKPSYFVGETAKLSVQGLGLCKNIEITWGDGSKDNIAEWNFGNIAGQTNLVAKHKYSTAQTAQVVVKTMGSSLNEQCGSRSTSVNVYLAGQISKISSAPNPVLVNKPTTITIDGSGVCPGDALISVTPPGGGVKQILSSVFSKNAAWPRKATFTPTEVGTYIVHHALAPGQNMAATIGCFGQPVEGDAKLVVQTPSSLTPTQPVNSAASAVSQLKLAASIIKNVAGPSTVSAGWINSEDLVLEGKNGEKCAVIVIAHPSNTPIGQQVVDSLPTPLKAAAYLTKGTKAMTVEGTSSIPGVTPCQGKIYRLIQVQ